MERARLACRFPRPRGKHRTHEKVPGVLKAAARKEAGRAGAASDARGGRAPQFRNSGLRLISTQMDAEQRVIISDGLPEPFSKPIFPHKRAGTCSRQRLIASGSSLIASHSPLMAACPALMAAGSTPTGSSQPRTRSHARPIATSRGLIASHWTSIAANQPPMAPDSSPMTACPPLMASSLSLMAACPSLTRSGRSPTRSNQSSVSTIMGRDSGGKQDTMGQAATGTGGFRNWIKFFMAGVSFRFFRRMMPSGSVWFPSAKGTAASR